jgi:hypothetical protein
MINRSINVMFSAPALWEAHDKGKAGRYVIIGPEGAWASLTPADGRERWRLMIHGEPDTDPETIDAAAEVRRAIGRDVDFRILKVGHWVRRRMVADQYGRGRVFLAGDAVHVMPPNGGLGMNTGIGDAVDLGWKLAAVYHGWGGRELLGSYECERRPVGIRQCDEAMRNFERYGSRKPVPHVTDQTAEGERVRRELGSVSPPAIRWHGRIRCTRTSAIATRGHRSSCPMVRRRRNPRTRESITRPASRGAGPRMPGSLTGARRLICSGATSPCCGLVLMHPIRQRWWPRPPAPACPSIV